MDFKTISCKLYNYRGASTVIPCLQDRSGYLSDLQRKSQIASHVLIVSSSRLSVYKYADSLRPSPSLELRQRTKIARELYELMNQALAE